MSGVYQLLMSDVIRVPDPVAERIERVSEREDMPKGEVVRDWMEKAEKWMQYGEVGR